MKQDTLVEKIHQYLHSDEVDYIKLATTLGVNALTPLKKIIASENLLASKAQVLENAIRLYFNEPLEGKKRKSKTRRFSPLMRTIRTIMPDGHIKSFASDMRRSK